MSLPRPRTRLHCRPLEDRTTPAVAAALNGGTLVLTGDNSNSDVLITVNAGNIVDVTVNGAAAGSFHPTAGLFATMGTGSDKFHLNLNGNTLALSNVVLRGGDGNDELTIDAGTLQASVWMLGGNGDDSLTIGGATVTGTAVVLDGGAGNDTGLLGGATITAGTWISGVQILNLGGTKFTGNLTVQPGEAAAATVAFAGNDISGSVYYFGTSADDQMNLGGGTNIAGNLFASLGSGNNKVVVDPGATLGRTQVWGGSGDDTLTFGSGASTKNVDLFLGNGANSVAFSGTAVTGSLRIWGGDGSDTVSMGAHDSISGNVSLYLGNGANTFTGAHSMGGSFTYFGGSGVDTVNLFSTRGASYPVTLRLGDGDDTFTYTHNTAEQDPTSFNIDFGAGNDTFNHNVPITWPSTVVGL